MALNMPKIIRGHECGRSIGWRFGGFPAFCGHIRYSPGFRIEPRNHGIAPPLLDDRNHKTGLSCEIMFLPFGSTFLLSRSFTAFSDLETREISASDRTRGSRMVFSNLPATLTGSAVVHRQRFSFLILPSTLRNVAARYRPFCFREADMILSREFPTENCEPHEMSFMQLIYEINTDYLA
jgi:hypothetical protein